jgi:hypothetical protein
MTFVVLLTFTIGALASLGVARAADRHRRWTLAMALRSRRRVLDALAPTEREAWQPDADAPRIAAPDAVRRIVLRVKE